MYEQKAKELRRLILDIAYKTGKGHLGGTFSVIDILVSLYYSGLLKFDPTDLKWNGRDIVLVGKGHACLATYCILADQGAISYDMLNEFGTSGGKLGTQFDISFDGAESNTGSLGHVVGVGAGYALAFKLLNQSRRVFVIIGDGECDEGSVWESLDFAYQHNLHNLVIIIDNNGLSVTDHSSRGLSLYRKLGGFSDKIDRIDGHNMNEIKHALDSAYRQWTGGPQIIIANTVKGKGVSFMESNPKWHQSAMTPKEYEIAREELQ